MRDFYSLAPAQQAERLTGLARTALPRWGIEDAKLDLLKHRENAVYAVTAGDGTRSVLRVHRAGYHTDEELLSELEWMQALDAYGVHTPPIVPAQDGGLFHVVEADGVPEPRQCDVLGWVDGKPLGSVEEGVEGDHAASFRTIGKLAAKVHNQATSWTLPEGFTRHAWDVEGLVGEQPFWGRFWELALLTDAQRALVLRARDRLREDLAAFGTGDDRYSLIHADFVAENFLVTDDDIKLIDFDDAGFGWHLFELATVLIWHLGEDHYDTVQSALIEGYRSLRELPDEHLETLPAFFLARGLTYLGWVHTRSETETAKELGPTIVGSVCELAEEYLEA